MKDYIKNTPSGEIILFIKVITNSTKNTLSASVVEYLDQEYIKFYTNKKPINGIVNKFLINVLSKKFKVNKSSIKIISGETSSYKKILIKSIDYDKIKIRDLLTDPI